MGALSAISLTGQQSLANHHTAADAGGDGEKDAAFRPLPGPQTKFAPRRGLRIVECHGRYTGQFSQCVGQRKVSGD